MSRLIITQTIMYTHIRNGKVLMVLDVPMHYTVYATPMANCDNFLTHDLNVFVQ